MSRYVQRNIWCRWNVIAVKQLNFKVWLKQCRLTYNARDVTLCHRRITHLRLHYFTVIFWEVLRCKRSLRLYLQLQPKVAHNIRSLYKWAVESNQDGTYLDEARERAGLQAWSEKKVSGKLKNKLGVFHASNSKVGPWLVSSRMRRDCMYYTAESCTGRQLFEWF